jgi:hypothetical protein
MLCVSFEHKKDTWGSSLGKVVLMSFRKKVFTMVSPEAQVYLKCICVSPTYKGVSNECTREV